MPKTLRIVILWLTLALFLPGCKKENIDDKDMLIEHAEELSTLNATVSSAGSKFIEVQWKQVISTHFKAVTYSILLNDQKIIEGLTTTKFSLINLKPGQKYSIKVIASTSEGKQLSQVLDANTLNSIIGGQGLYEEYSIHSYSTITGGTALQRLNDGGHLIICLLQHPISFDNENFKILIFRTDQTGKMLWYRLLPLSAYNFSIYGQLLLNTNKNEQEGLLFLQQHAIRFATSNGEILQQKNFETEAPGAIFQSTFYASAQNILVGTQQGNLLSINPNDLSLIWHQNNSDRRGAIIAINLDSKKNIYYIFRDSKDRHYNIRVHKCNANGEFLKDFLFDGTLPNESNWGFWMTALLVDKQDNLYLFGRNSDYNYMRWFKFSTEGIVIKKNQTTDNLKIDNAFFNAKDEIVVSGQIDGSLFNTYGGIYIFDKDMNIKSKRIYQEIPYHIVRGITGNPDGSYNIFLNYITTYTYDNRNFVFIKTDIDGKI